MIKKGVKGIEKSFSRGVMLTDDPRTDVSIWPSHLYLHLIKTPLNTYANKADPDKAALDQGLLYLLMEI